MDKVECMKILAILRIAYPGFYKATSAKDHSDTVVLWATMFPDDPFELVSAAVKTFIASDEKGFPPHIGAIKAAIAKLTQPDALTEAEAWNIVRGKMSCYATRADFLSLPPVIQRAVGSASQLCQWAMTDMESMPVIQSNFMRSFRAAQAAEQQRAKIPKDVLALIDGRKQAMLLEHEPNSECEAGAWG
ncbi:MAG: replicative helicase loader/inhibitor [Eubacteriales bacterium]|nr:replicative helicase loader/inhibitor [Eubacteriales bacterium]